MATLDDLKDILDSIDRTMVDQKDLLTNMFNLQETRNRLSSVDTTTVSGTGQGIGAAAAGIGAGVGSAAAGVGSAAAGIGIAGILGLGALAMFADFDAEAIKENVVTLLSISDEVGGKEEFFKEGGTFFAVMTGMGIGLAAFGIGEGLVGLGQWITDDKWTKTLKTNVVALLSIADEVGGKVEILEKGGTFGLAMTGLGIGLGVFGVGQAAVGFAQFIAPGGWAEEVKKNVVTLLSISEDVDTSMIDTLGIAGTFTAVMFGLGFGLRKFAIGAALTGGLAEVIADWGSGGDWTEELKRNVGVLLSIGTLANDSVAQTFARTGAFAVSMFGLGFGLGELALGAGALGVAELIADWATGGDWAKEIMNNVAILLSIGTLAQGDVVQTFARTGAFIAVMGGLGFGLAAFAAAAGVVGIAELLADWATGEDWAQEVKDNVMTLLSISKGVSGEGMLAALGEGGTFVGVMAGIAAGLFAFSGGNFVGTLLDVAGKVFTFFTGAESPITQIKQIADDAERLERGADALVTISNALETFGKIKFSGANLNFKQLAIELGQAIPFLDKLARGGTVEGSGGWYGLGEDITFPEGGILNPNLKLDEMAEAIAKVNFILGKTTEYPVETAASAATQTGNQNARLTSSVAAAVAESQLVSINAEQVRIETETATINRFQPQAELVSKPDRDRQGQMTNIDASNKSVKTEYKGGPTYVSNNILQPSRTKNDLDYYFGQ